MSYPANKLSIEAARQEFADAGCTLLEDKYIDNKHPMRFVCHCGGEGVKSLVKFRVSKACKQCGYHETGTKNGRKSLEMVAQEFRNLGHVLLATEYKNNAATLPYICKCGAFYAMSLASLLKGSQCPDCAGRKIWDFASVSAYLADQGCKLLESEYKGSNKPMRYKCACGIESTGTFGNFYSKGVRCFACGVAKNSGVNSHQYKPEKTDDERVVQRKYPAYVTWRKDVFSRDDFTCQCCGEKGGTLHAHHLDNYADHKELRTEISNGVTLCKSCHLEFHSIYGQRNITTSTQFNEFKETHHA